MIYFVSDAHIGSKAITRGWAHQKKFIQLLNKLGEDAVSIYLMGDIFDFWFEYYTKDKSKKEYQPLFRCIRHLVRKGVHVHYFVGNHDMWTWGGLTSMTGMEVHFEPTTIRRYGKLLYLAHGDGIVPFDLEHHYPREAQAQIRKFMRLRKIFQNEFLQFLFRCLPPAWGNKIGYTWAAKSRQKELDNPCPFKGEKNEELVLFAKEDTAISNSISSWSPEAASSSSATASASGHTPPSTSTENSNSITTTRNCKQRKNSKPLTPHPYNEHKRTTARCLRTAAGHYGRPAGEMPVGS